MHDPRVFGSVMGVFDFGRSPDVFRRAKRILDRKIENFILKSSVRYQQLVHMSLMLEHVAIPMSEEIQKRRKMEKKAHEN